MKKIIFCLWDLFFCFSGCDFNTPENSISSTEKKSSSSLSEESYSADEKEGIVFPDPNA